jgi:hypothetical protein
MSKITADHLAGSAHIYVHESTLGQAHRNHESGQRSYGLVERAKRLGWSNVVAIDNDLAISIPAASSRQNTKRGCEPAHIQCLPFQLFIYDDYTGRS